MDLLIAPWGTPFHIAIAAGAGEATNSRWSARPPLRCALRELKPGNIWFPTSAIPDRIGRGARPRCCRRTGARRAAVHRPTCCRSRKEIKQFLDARAAEGGHLDVGQRGVSARHQGHDGDARAGEGRQSRRGAGPVLSQRFGALRQAGEGAGPRARRSSSSPSARPWTSSARSLGNAADGFVTIGHWTRKAGVAEGEALLRCLYGEVQ